MKIILVILTFCLVGFSNSQEDSIIRSWDYFYQDVDVSQYRGLEFRFSSDVKIVSSDSSGKVRLFVWVTNKNGRPIYIDDMRFSPVQQTDWKNVYIEGYLNKNAQKMRLGAYYENAGIFNFDNLHLNIKIESNWNEIELINNSFQDLKMSGWNFSSIVVKGFSRSIIFDSLGNSILQIDGREHYSFGSNAKSGKYCITEKGVRLYYEIYGEGFPIIFLHGNSQSIEDFSAQIIEISKFFKVIAMDTRGQGKSTVDNERLTYDLFATDVECLYKHLELDSVNLLGWSDGGNTALTLAINDRIKIHKIAIMGANLFNDRSSVKLSANLGVIIAQRRLKINGDINSIEYRLLQLVREEPHINPDDLNKITAKVMVMAGSNDIIKLRHTKMIADEIPNSQLIIFKRGTHFEPITNPKRFNKTILNFFFN